MPVQFQQPQTAVLWGNTGGNRNDNRLYAVMCTLCRKLSSPCPWNML